MKRKHLNIKVLYCGIACLLAGAMRLAADEPSLESQLPSFYNRADGLLLMVGSSAASRPVGVRAVSGENSDYWTPGGNNDQHLGPDDWEGLTDAVALLPFAGDRRTHDLPIPVEKQKAYAVYRLVFLQTHGNELRIQSVSPILKNIGAKHE